MKKFWYIGLVVIVVVLLLATACTGLIADAEKTKEEAMKDFENGDLSKAEESLETVLKFSADDPDANAAMAFIKLYYGLKNLGDVIEEASDTEILNAIKAVKSEENEITVEEVLSKVKIFQDGLDEKVIPYFEEVLKYAETALKGKEINLKLYPNKIDWDSDGESEPSKPLKFKVTNPYTGETVEVSMKDLYSCSEKAEYLEDAFEGEAIIEIDPSGGDAIFNYETFEKAALGEDSCEATVEFNDNDYLTIDKGEVYAIKSFAEYLLAYFYPTTIYSFELPEGAVEALQNSIDSSTPTDVVKYLDDDKDNVIEYNEWKDQLGDFLSFRSNGKDHLKNELIVIGNAAKDSLNLRKEITEDDQGTETHNLTSSDFFKDLEVTDEDQKSVDEIVSYTLESSPIVVKDYNGTAEATINLFVLREHPERFSDLKNFLPKIEYSLETESATIVEYPDETFGGLVEGLNLQTPTPIKVGSKAAAIRAKMAILRNIAKHYIKRHVGNKIRRFLSIIKNF